MDNHVKRLNEVTPMEELTATEENLLSSNVYYETGKRDVPISCQGEIELTNFKVNEINLNLEVSELGE